MKEPVLVVMAAGMGSRYGGLKQIDPVDQEGHIIMDFSIYDAVRAGFKKVIFIIKKENEQDFRDAIGDRLSDKVEIVYVHQDLNNIPEGFQVPEGRVKPWGTGHAVLSCAGEIDGPFVVINADDYDDEYDAPTGTTRNLGRSAKKSKKGRKSDDYDVDFIDL